MRRSSGRKARTSRRATTRRSPKRTYKSVDAWQYGRLRSTAKKLDEEHRLKMEEKRRELDELKQQMSMLREELEEAGNNVGNLTAMSNEALIRALTPLEWNMLRTFRISVLMEIESRVKQKKFEQKELTNLSKNLKALEGDELNSTGEQAQISLLSYQIT